MAYDLVILHGRVVDGTALLLRVTWRARRAIARLPHRQNGVQTSTQRRPCRDDRAHDGHTHMGRPGVLDPLGSCRVGTASHVVMGHCGFPWRRLGYRLVVAPGALRYRGRVAGWTACRRGFVAVLKSCPRSPWRLSCLILPWR